MSKNTNRNAPCPCGSGKKYKNCCAVKKTTFKKQKWSPLTTALILIGVFAAGAGVTNMLLSNGDTNQNESPPFVSPGSLKPQPPGPVPAGKVWSSEHGHWHDSAQNGTASAPITTSTASGRTPGPQPPGPVPEGKEWSEEHGHWHNKPGYVGPETVVNASVEKEEETVSISEEIAVDAPTEFEEVIVDVVTEE